MTNNHSEENQTPSEQNLEELEILDREAALDKQLGIAGRIANSFIDSPITPLLMVAALFIGLLGLMFTPRQEDPEISVPMVDLFVQYPGASAAQVSSLVTEPLERIMAQIPGVKHVYSASMRGQAIVTVRFKVGEPLGPSIVKVHDKLQSNMDMIPPGVSMPLVKPKGINDVPVVTVTLSSDSVDDATLRTLSVDVMQRLREIPDSGQSFVVGGRAEQVRVEINPERMAGFNLTLDQLAQTINAANQELHAGSTEGGNSTFSVYTGGFLRSAGEIGRLVLATRGGIPIYLRDVAKVSHGPEDPQHIVNFYGGRASADAADVDAEPAVTIAIAKKEGTNGVTVANDLLAKLDTLRGDLIPDNVRVTITRDYGKTANDKVNDLLSALFEAAGLVSLLCMIGLGLRPAFVVISVIPVVILVTVWSAWALDYSINRVSLFALIFSIGILVDDAIVVVENIYRRWLAAGRTTVGIAVDAVREVGNPTILATLTIISALLPMGWVSGLMGPYMRPIPVLGSSAMFFSLVAAFIFTPWFTLRVRPIGFKAFRKAEAREIRTHAIIGKFYEPIIWPLINNRKLGVVFLIFVIGLTAAACSLFYFKVVAVKMLPFDNKPEFNVVVNMPEGTALPVTANVVHELAEAIRAGIPEVTAIQTYVGTASPFNFNGLVRHYYLRQFPWQGDIQVMLLDRHERERTSHQLSVAARELLAPLGQKLGVRSVQVVEMPPGPPVLQTVVAEVHGPDAATRREVATAMRQMFINTEGLVDADTYMADPHTYWHFNVDREKATRVGVTVEAINRNLAMAMGGYKLGDIKLGAPLEPTYIVMQAPLAVRSQVAQLANLPIPTAEGKTIPLGELGTFVREEEDPYIYHKDLRGIEYVTGEMTGRLGAPIYGMFGVEDQVKEYTTPDGVVMEGMPMNLLGAPENDLKSDFEWSGEWTVTYETFRDMGLAFMAAMLLIYALIVVEFRDYALAGLIMAPIPLTLIGIIPGHWLMGAEFTATSMIGMIALGGIIVRVSILLVEFVKIEVESGKDIREAAVEAAKTRMRPILITSLTAILSSTTILSDPIFNGMAVSLIFGMTAATLFTMIVIPLGCISAEKRFKRYHELDKPAIPADARGTVESTPEL